MNRITYAVASLTLALVACRGGDDGPGGDDTPEIDAPMVAADVTIQEVQNDAMPSGTAIELKGVVVTAIDIYGGSTGNFFVSEPGGGPNSGVKIFGARADQVASIAVGDIVDITGAIKHEGCTAAAPCGTIIFDNGASITEVKGTAAGTLVVTKTGTGTVPAPVEVDAAAIAALPTPAARDAEWEKWEGVLIKVVKARQIGVVRGFSGDDSEPDQFEFRATGFVRVQSGLSALPTTSTFGICYASMTGVLDFFFNYGLQPRSADDLVTGGTNCNPAATSVAMIQTGMKPEVVILTNVIVTARDDIGMNNMETPPTPANRGFWVADAAAAAPNNGVYVFTRDKPVPATFVIGAVVSIQGGVTEFDLGMAGMPPVGDTLTEVVDIVDPPTFVSAGTTVPTPVTVAANVLADIGPAGEPYEGVLVQVTNVKVTNIMAGSGKVELADNSGNKIIMDDDSFDWPNQNLNTCYATLTGVMSVQVSDNVRTLNPRAMTDMVAGTGCN